MLTLLARDDYAALGLATLLDTERIAYRRVDALGADDGGVVVAVGADLTREESLALAARRALVLHGGVAFARHALGVRGAGDDAAAVLPLSEALWPSGLFAAAQPFGITGLRLPRAPILRLDAPPRGVELGTLLVDGGAGETPAAVRVGECWWCAVDLGTAFAHLLTERYAPLRRPRAAALQGVIRRLAESTYYAAPARLRARLQRAAYARLTARLHALGERASAYPIDAAGWLTVELVVGLLRRAAGRLVRLAHWPHGHQAAAVLTHDVEPRRYAYRSGLPRLLAADGAAQPRGALGLVARPAGRYLTGADVAGREVYCHGLDHRGEAVWGRRRVRRGLERARALLEAQFGRAVTTYRSPRLDRSPDLDHALDAAGFALDSSRPDVDRENLAHYGRGVRLALPYRPLLEDAAGGWRTSRCLELPLTAPDCIQPLFAGADETALRAAVVAKAAWVRVSGGCYVALVHPGVFGADDAARRERHLAFVREALTHPDTWFAELGAVADWWRAREQVHLTVESGGVRVFNAGAHALDGAALWYDDEDGARRLALPPLPAGGAVRIGLAVQEGACARP